MSAINYGQALRDGCHYLLKNHPEVFVIGQGLWSPWYVGNSMTDLDKEFGKERVIDTPVSENACTGAAIGASLSGYRPIVIHPRMDFMILATDPIVNQAAKWSSMMGGKANPAVTVRGIINRGGEQGAQHSQAIQAWFAHVPGLRVVMPASVQDARELLVASVLSDDPVLFVDDRWLYDQTAELGPVQEWQLEDQGPEVIRSGNDLTLVGSGYTTLESLKAAEELERRGVSAEVIDLRVLNPFHSEELVKSVKKTGRLVVVDGGSPHCGVSSEVIASVTEQIPGAQLPYTPLRLTPPHVPAPTSKPLERAFYRPIQKDGIVESILKQPRTDSTKGTSPEKAHEATL